jgi:phosphinothricin acetyltransferase
MVIRDASIDDLAAIVAIYNAGIPGRMATADLAPVSLESRRQWFDEHVPGSRPLWVVEEGGQIEGWLSLQAFHVRAAYHPTADGQRLCRAGRSAKTLCARTGGAGDRARRRIRNRHDARVHLRAQRAEPRAVPEFRFRETWGHLPRVAELDGIERDVLILGRRID